MSSPSSSRQSLEPQKYKVLSDIGTGAQGTSFLARDLLNVRQILLKQIECKDTVNASQVLRELNELKKIHHTYISPYYDYFISFDKKISAVYVNVVREYSAAGTLAEYLQSRRNNKLAVPEEAIKYWLGQLTDVLRYLSGGGINAPHRRLQPSNLLMCDSLGLSAPPGVLPLKLVDAAVPSVMLDLRYRTRSNADDFVWTAPEVTPPSRGRHSWASEMWSLGAILFAAATCSDKWQALCASLDTSLLRRQTTGLSALSESAIKPENWSPAETNSLLRALKLRRETLEALTQTLTGTQEYNAGLIDVIQHLLIYDISERASIQSIAAHEYVSECLAMSDSDLLKRRERQRMSLAEKPLPTEGTTETLVEYIGHESSNEQCVLGALKELLNLEMRASTKVAGEQPAEDGETALRLAAAIAASVQTVARAVYMNAASADVCFYGVAVLERLFRKVPVRHTPELVALVKLFKHVFALHENDVRVIEVCCRCITIYAVNRANAKAASDAGLILWLTKRAYEAAVSQTGRVPEEERSPPLKASISFYTELFRALWALCIADDATAQALDCRLLQAVSAVLAAHVLDTELVRAITLLLLGVLNEDTSVADVLEANLVWWVLQVLVEHTDNAKLVRNALLVLAAMAALNEDLAFTLMECERRAGVGGEVPASGMLSGRSTDAPETLDGIKLLTQCFKAHADNVEIVEALCALINELIKHEVVVSYLANKKGFLEMVRTIRKRFGESKEVRAVCNRVEDRVGFAVTTIQ